MASVNHKPLLSICIPTRGRNQILSNTLNTIFETAVDEALYEVLIYDSSDDNELENILIKKYPYDNITYKKGENFGFLNLIESLKMGEGYFLKLHNDYCGFSAGGLASILKTISEHISNKPVLFFSNQSLKEFDIKECSTFDDFLHNVSFYSSWSTVFGLWKTDFDEIKNITINPMFPHTSLLFALSDKKSFIIENKELFINQNVVKKGGYDLFYTFSIDFLGMVEDCWKDNKISYSTFEYIKADMMQNFFITWYCDTKIMNNSYTFLLKDIKKSINKHYVASAYYTMLFSAYWLALKRTVKAALQNLSR